MTMTDAAKLRELEDREAIRQVFVDYARFLDGADYAGYTSLFARDAVFREAKGREAIGAQMVAYGERVAQGRVEGRFTDAVHVMTNHDISIDGDKAKAVVTWSYLAIDPDQMPILMQMGHYNDELIREDGAWKISLHSVDRIMGRGQLEAAQPSRLGAAQARLQELEDKEAIRQIFTDYARFLDSGDFEGYAGLFARNGWMKASLGEATGPEEILVLLNKYREAAKGKNLPKAKHIVNNHDIVIDGDKATAKVLWFYLTTQPDGTLHILQGGVYSDDLVREDGTWKLVNHDITRLFGRGPHEPATVTRIDTIEQRLQAVEDRQEINDLCIKVSNCLDRRDLDGYGNCFTEDGEWSGIVGRATGPAAISEILSIYCKPWESEGHRTYHTLLDLVITLDGDTASAISKWQHYHRAEDDSPYLKHLGLYDDRFRRTPDGWRFTRRAAYGAIPYFEPKFQLLGLAENGLEPPVF
jgi:ketosteroid isomerase-like protein